MGRPLSDEHPRLDARLPDGSRIHVILPPMARCGTMVSIRKFHPGGLTVEDLVRGGSLTAEAARFLEVIVGSKQNIIVAGGTRNVSGVDDLVALPHALINSSPAAVGAVRRRGGSPTVQRSASGSG